MKAGKKRKAALEKVQHGHRYPLDEACLLVKGCAYARFDESVDVSVRLGIDPKQADQQVRGACILPHGTGTTKRVLVFAKGDKVNEAKDAGADHVGGDDYFKKISEEGWLEFDTVIATPDMMGVVGRLGLILGPRGLMPNPKVGTVTFDVAKAVSDAKGGKIEFKVERKGAIIHVPVGKASFSDNKLRENVRGVGEHFGATQTGVVQRNLFAEHYTQFHDGSWCSNRSKYDRAGRLSMPLTLEEKKAQVEGIRANFEKAISTVFIDFRGVDVETITALRVQFRNAGIEYRVIKNNLIKKALEGTKFEDNTELASSLKGMTGIAWSYEDPSTAAKILKQFRKDHKEVLAKKDEPEKLISQMCVARRSTHGEWTS